MHTELKIVKEDNIRLVKENATLVDLLPGRGGYRKRKQFVVQHSTHYYYLLLIIVIIINLNSIIIYHYTL